MNEIIIIKLGEVYLRKGNRHIFVNKLASDIYKNLSGLHGCSVIKAKSRITIRYDESTDSSKIYHRIKNIFGIGKIAVAYSSEDKSLDNIKNMSLDVIKSEISKLGIADGKITFKVETKRYDKGYPLDSYGVSAAVGEFILNNMPQLSVNVHSPQITVNIELGDSISVYTESMKGQGGLPYGCTGKGVALLSGGIDSPVACYLMAKRGVEIEAVYFHSPPYTSERAKDKVCDLAKRLSEYTGSFKLNIVNFSDVQMLLHERVPDKKLTILLKRSMLKIAETIAVENKTHCLITGDSIGQVASQTMQSILAVESASRLPVIRPLAGMDKQEIVDIAISIDTYNISIRPYDDCCTLFVAEHPETKPNAFIIEKIENGITQLNELLEKAATEREIINFEKNYLTK